MKRFLAAVAIVTAVSGVLILIALSNIVLFFVILSLAFLLGVSGTLAGLWLAWPRGGRGWEWKKAWLLIVSAIFLAAAVALIVVVTIAMFNVDQ